MNLDLDLLVAVLATVASAGMLLNWWRFRTGRRTHKSADERRHALIGGVIFAVLATINWLEFFNII